MRRVICLHLLQCLSKYILQRRDKDQRFVAATMILCAGIRTNQIQNNIFFCSTIILIVYVQHFDFMENVLVFKGCELVPAVFFPSKFEVFFWGNGYNVITHSIIHR